MFGITDITVRPSYKLQRAIEHGDIDPSINGMLDFFCYRKAKALLRLDSKQQLEMYKECPEHLRPMISKWVRKLKLNKKKNKLYK